MMLGMGGGVEGCLGMLLETAILTLNVELMKLVKEEREKEEIVGEMETDKGGGGRGKRIKERKKEGEKREKERRECNVSQSEM